MKKLILIFFLLSFCHSIESQDCDLKKEIIESVLANKSIQNFFGNNKKIIVCNSNCKNLSFFFGEKEVFFVEDAQDFTIKFLKYIKKDSIIYVTLSFNNKNVINVLKYEILNDKLINLNNEIIFHKTPKKE